MVALITAKTLKTNPPPDDIAAADAWRAAAHSP